jgi:hypothetical protein
LSRVGRREAGKPCWAAAPWVINAALKSAALAKVHRKNEEFGKLSRSYTI